MEPRKIWFDDECQRVKTEKNTTYKILHQNVILKMQLRNIKRRERLKRSYIIKRGVGTKGNRRIEGITWT